MTPDIWMILAFAGLLIAGVPVAFSLALSGAVGIVLGLSPDMLATLGCERADSTQQPPQQHNQANHKPQPQGQLAKLQGQ